MGRRLVVLVVLLSVALTGLLETPAATAVPVWTPPAVLGSHARQPVLASNGAGDTVAVWMGSRGLSASFRPANGGWSASKPVSEEAVDEYSQGLSLHVVLDDARRATVLWTIYDYGCNGCPATPATTSASTGTAAQGWSAPVQLSEDSDATPDLAVDARGTVTAVWDYPRFCGYDAGVNPVPCPDGIARRLAFSSRPVGGAWSAETDVASGPAGGGAVPALAAGPDGTLTLLAMTGNSTGTAHLVAFTKAPGQPWSAPQALDSGDVSWFTRVVVASDASGAVTVGAILCGTATTHDSCRVETFTKSASSTAWSPPVVLQTVPSPPPGTSTALAALAVNGDGVASFAWALPSADPTLATAARERGRWADPTTLRTQRVPSALAVAVNAAGAAVTSWTEASTSSWSVLAAYRPAASSWQQPFVVSASSPLPANEAVSVTASGSGRFTAGFETTSGRAGASYSDRVDDMTAPTARLTGPAARLTSAVFRVSWRSVDRPAGVAGVDVRRRTATWRTPFGRWSLWKRHTSAASAVFRGAAGRTYCFSVRATDRAGHSSRWSRQRCTSTPVDDRSARASSGWARTRSRAAFHRTLTTSSRFGAQLSLGGARGRQYSLVAATCRACGTVRVSLGGHAVRTVSLRSATSRPRRVFSLASYRRAHAGRLVLTVVSHRRPVLIDGVVVRR